VNEAEPNQTLAIAAAQAGYNLAVATANAAAYHAESQTLAVSGKSEEKNQLRQRLESDRYYVLDRWNAEFALWTEIVAHGSSYICRIRDNSNLSQVVEERPLTPAAQAAGVLKDQVVRLGTKADQLPLHPVRVILVQTTTHDKTGGRKSGTAGPPSDGILRIATNLLDVPADPPHRTTVSLFLLLTALSICLSLQVLSAAVLPPA
jgi:hypothetical protein